MSYLQHDNDVRFWVGVFTSRTIMSVLRRELDGISDPPREEIVYKTGTAFGFAGWS